MSTTGIDGFVVDGKEKLAWYSGDMYPSSGGWYGLEWFRRQDIRELQRLVRDLEVIPDVEGHQPSAHQRRRAEQALEPLGVRVNWDQTDHLWDDCAWEPWDVAREHDPLTLGLLTGIVSDASWRVRDSLFCEWGYVWDLDRAVFELYEGVQRRPHQEGRFAHLPPLGASPEYYPVRLIAEWPFSGLPTEREFLRAAKWE